jgi:hypothetical protein
MGQIPSYFDPNSRFNQLQLDDGDDDYDYDIDKFIENTKKEKKFLNNPTSY